MTNKLPLYILLALLGLAAIGCNSDKDDTETVALSNVAIEKFSLKNNDKVLANLDSVFFSIDLAMARIYNADSLPKGTDVSRLVVDISAPSVRSMDLIVHRGGTLGDTTINYLANQKDSIDFSYGPVTLRVTAEDGSQVRDYTVSVNVHKVLPDSLAWGKAAMRALPTALAAPESQKTVEADGKLYCLTLDYGNNASLAVASDPSGQWETETIALPFPATNVDLSTFTVMDGFLYISDNDGALYESIDGGFQWLDTGARFNSIFGVCEGVIMGARRDDAGAWFITSYPSGNIAEMPAPDGFPVTGNSQLLVFTSAWSETPVAIMAGGLKADGNPTGETWAWDGSRWASLTVDSRKSLPAMSGVTIVPYFAFKTSSLTWSVTQESVLLAMGGRYSDGSLSHDVYISWDSGITWKAVDTPMRLPDYIPEFADAQAFVFNSTIGADSGSADNTSWKSKPVARLPRWWKTAAPSRVSQLPDEWECPYIYLFGGVDLNGMVHDSVWRGVINRLTFSPLY